MRLKCPKPHLGCKCLKGNEIQVTQKRLDGERALLKLRENEIEFVRVFVFVFVCEWHSHSFTFAKYLLDLIPRFSHPEYCHSHRAKSTPGQIIDVSTEQYELGWQQKRWKWAKKH